MRILSKSKLLAYRQCPKRLWLEIYRPDLREDSAATQAAFKVGHQVGEIARRLYDPKDEGALVELQKDDLQAAFSHTTELLRSSRPIFEAGFASGGAMAFADIMLPLRKQGHVSWRMVEVKSSTSVKDYYRDDTAIQAFVARGAGVPLDSIAIAHIDREWVYAGAEKYEGLLKERDLTEEAFGRQDEVKTWISESQNVVALADEPRIATGRQCGDPYECGFLEYCRSKEKQAKYPVSWLPRMQSRQLRSLIEERGVKDMGDVPDDLLKERQRRVKAHTVAGTVFFDAEGAKSSLQDYEPPAYFLDFETIYFAVPIWKGTRPYQQIPFQFSVHRVSQRGELTHEAFLDLAGDDPSRKLAEALINACGDAGPVFVYNAAFEIARIRELADRYPELQRPLRAINTRIFDLLMVAEQYY